MQCYACFGKGDVTCPTCHGNGNYWKVVGRQNVFEPCSQCGGKRTVKCVPCDGTGQIPPRRHPLPPPPPTLPVEPALVHPDPALLHLEGRWKGFGARYEFVRENGGYRVTQFNFLGMRIAEGEAESSGNVLTMTLRNKLMSTTADLQFDRDRLTGKTRGLIPLPITLKRAA